MMVSRATTPKSDLFLDLSIPALGDQKDQLKSLVPNADIRSCCTSAAGGCSVECPKEELLKSYSAKLARDSEKKSSV